MSQQREKSVSITRIVSASFCEQKVVFDRTYGQKKTAEVAQKAAQGEREHLRFESEGRALAARGPILQQPYGPAPTSAAPRTDKRCFIASAVYGEDAPETNTLRAWRDSVLKASFMGRLVISVYYCVSPTVVSLIAGKPRLLKTVRRLLEAFLRRIGR